MCLKSNRRTFLKQLAIGSGVVSMGPMSLASVAQSTIKSKFETQFVNPPALARPFYRWWWNGNRVTANEIKRELRLMKDKGAGGVEINPIALDEQYYDTPSAKPLDWLSDEWLQMVQVTVDEAKALDMYVDMIVGTGWPFGGKFLKPEETIQGIELEIRDLQGAGPVEIQLDIPQDENHKIVQLKVYPKSPMSVDDGVDVMKKMSSDGKLKLDLATGEYQLYILTWRNQFRDVLHGAPGADGPVLDHFNKSVVETYLNKMSDALKTVLGNDLGAHIRSMFCDSIELEGANWTGDLPDEFKSRYGYDLLPWLPLVLNRDIGANDSLKNELKRVRYDMSKLLADLFMERFILPFHNWCRQNNVKSRYQAYGHPWLYTDLVDGYLVPDIRESDQWLFNRGWVHEAEIDQIRYAIWNKYASSGAHLTGRNIVSCEAMTNTRGVFRASLEYIKQATDLNVVCGVNHLVLHGFNYSPPKSGFPGWIRYGTYFNENNTWWPYTKYWFDYAARLSFVFQNSRPVTQIAVLGNTPDKWADYGLDRNPWNNGPHYLHQLWQAFNHFGYLTDYVNATVIENAEFVNGELRYGPAAFKLLLVTDVQTITLNTARALEKYAVNGGQIVFIGPLPSKSPGHIDHEKESQRVQSTIQNLIKSHPENVKNISGPEKGKVVPWALHTIQGLRLLPDVLFTIPDKKLFFVHHTLDDKDFYFISNQNRDKSLEFDASFNTGKKIPWKMNAENGEIVRYPHGRLPEIINVKLAPLESLLVMYAPENEKQVSKKGVDALFSNQYIDKDFFQDSDLEKYDNIKGPWNVRLEHINGTILHKKLATIQDLSLLKDLAGFSGTAVYLCQFTSSFSGKALLDLGKVHEIAEVSLNGRELGVKWWGQRRYEIELEFGKEYTLEIKVVNLIFNYCLSLKDNKAAQLWVERTGRAQPEPSGLLGPVKVYPLKK